MSRPLYRDVPDGAGPLTGAGAGEADASGEGAAPGGIPDPFPEGLPAPHPSREELDQRYLVAAVGVLRARLEALYGVEGADADRVEASRDALRQAAAALQGPAPLDTLSATFGLSAFECDILLLCAGVELDGGFGDLCRVLTGGRGVTFSLALSLGGDEAHWSALTPGSALREWQLVEVDPQEGLTTAPLRIDERVLHHLTGLRYLDAELAGFVKPLEIPGGAGVEVRVPSHARAAAAIVRRVEEQAGRGLVQLAGPDEDGKRRVAGEAAARLGMGLYLLPAALLPRGAAELHRLTRLWEREAFFSQAALFVDAEELPAGDPDRIGSLVAFLEGIRGLVFLATRERLPVRGATPFSLDVGRPTPAEQATLWRAALGEWGRSLNGEVERLTTHFDLDVQGIQGAVRRLDEPVVRGAGRADTAGVPGVGRPKGAIDVAAGADTPAGRLWNACRLQARPRLDHLARRIEPRVGWEALVLPELQMQTLRSIAAHVRHRATVHGSWGFEADSHRGTGISALFAGPSGTGKTMAAEVLAAELALDLYVIDLSQVVNKYIGETEKNLARVFDAAERGGAVLLFDEADALFGKRSEVKDSHDRYANIEVSYLLQRMESYRGLAILTTNMKSALDDAFLRRLRFVVTFPFPGVAQREEIWRRILPEKLPVGDLDFPRLARLTVAGGHIRNIALNAAFLAAEGGGVVEMDHLMAAARVEYAKLERPFTESEGGGRR